MARIALVYAKNASSPPTGMDRIRWRQIGGHLAELGHEVHMVTDQPAGVRAVNGLPVQRHTDVCWDEFDLVKVCYQHSINLVPAHPALIVRMCRVVDARRPRRDGARRARYLQNQQRIAEVARFVAFNGSHNADRWRLKYGDRQEILIVPTGCPVRIPVPLASPFEPGRRIILFCGSITSPRFTTVLNRVGRGLARLGSDAQLHIVGRNRLHLYEGRTEPLDRTVMHVHEAVDEESAWQYILHADVGVAPAPSDDEFESELAKIYYYLRGGLPVVTESTVSNRSLVAETGHGAVAQFGNTRDLLDKIGVALSLRPRNARVMAHMAATHGWNRRAGVYADVLQRIGSPRDGGPTS